LVKLIINSIIVILISSIFIAIIVKEKLKIIEYFEDGSPKIIQISKRLFGNYRKIKIIEYWKKNKIRYEKQYKNNRPEGKQVFISNSGVKIEQWIKNGKRHGKYYKWNESGELVLEELWYNGKREKVIYKN
tara:strand:+ start:607 stop:999 length:393 start_codon:yes stop_codon:yes gene_type:complete